MELHTHSKFSLSCHCSVLRMTDCSARSFGASFVRITIFFYLWTVDTFVIHLGTLTYYSACAVWSMFLFRMRWLTVNGQKNLTKSGNRKHNLDQFRVFVQLQCNLIRISCIADVKLIFLTVQFNAHYFARAFMLITRLRSFFARKTWFVEVVKILN